MNRAFFSILFLLGVLPVPGLAVEIREEKGAFVASGLSREALQSLGETGAKLTEDQWKAIFSVRVMPADADAATDLPAMAGKWELSGGSLRFLPSFPPVQGVRYLAEFDPSAIPGSAEKGKKSAIFHRPVPFRKPQATVEAVYPSSDKLPENLLKFYLHFNDPMSQGEAYEHIELKDSRGKLVELPFLEIAQELWDVEGKRLTLLLDPGRIKRGLKPNQDDGRALRAGETYTLGISAKWKDARGTPMREAFQKKFAVIAADYDQPDPNAWEMSAPSPGTRDPFVIKFPEPLDHALLLRMLTMESWSGENIPGASVTFKGDAVWSFVPDAPWREGRVRLVVDPLLEDLCGNSIDRPFEVLGESGKILGERKPLTFEIEIKSIERKAKTSGQASRENWTSWRGPAANGISREIGLPLQWDGETKQNIIWSVDLKGFGAGTPIIHGDQIFLTSQIGSEPKARGPGASPGKINTNEKLMFVVQCFDRKDGREIWEKKFRAEGELTPTHSMHNLSTPSCTTDGASVVALFATGQIYAFDFKGNILWQRHLAREYHPFKLLWGHSSSPVIHGDLVYVLCDHNPAAYLLALNKHTGKEVWKADHGRGLRSYSTPLVVEIDGRAQVIVNSNPGIFSHDAKTGKEIWKWTEFCKVPVPVPVFVEGVLYASRGYSSGPFMAIRPGDAKPIWRIPSRAPYVSSPVVHDGLLYLAGERGRIICCDAKTGELVWVEQTGKAFWASPVYADGHLYLLAEDGEAFVLKVGRKYEVVARNKLGEDTLGSPAVSGGQIFIRTAKRLFCIGRE